MERKSGVLMHISSLYGAYSIGSFGQEAKEFVDFLADCGFSYWQVLPFCVADDYNSPYQSYSAFGGNPYFVDLDGLHRQGLLTSAQLAEARQITPYACEYARLHQERLPLLREAAHKVAHKEPVRQFIAQHPYLERFCRFMALKSANGQLPWYRWTKTEPDGDVLFLWQFIQYEFFRQWREIKAYANSKGVGIIGDIPFYVSLDSADVWGNPQLFQLDSAHQPTHVAGVPPDYFSQEGQLWGNPLYDWEAMAADGYQWWVDRVGHMLTLFDGVRIDHFRGIESYWSVPAMATTAKAGKWEKGPGMGLLHRLRREAGDRLLIAEDLGDITPAVAQLVEQSGFPGMRVFQFGFLSPQDTPHRPHNYSNNSVAYTGTHDNNTLLGYLWELDDHTRRRMLAYCGFEGADWGTGCPSILRTLFASHAGLVMLPIQDVLGYGADTRLNIPGKAGGNWQYRVTKEQLGAVDRGWFRTLNGLYHR